MNRTYTVAHYRKLIEKIRKTIPGVALSTDIISGFPSESAGDHRMTVDLIRELRFDGAFTFKYSSREQTKAWEMEDDVPDDEKGRRVWEVTELQHAIALEHNRGMIGSTERVLVEGASRKSPHEYTGRRTPTRQSCSRIPTRCRVISRISGSIVQIRRRCSAAGSGDVQRGDSVTLRGTAA